MYLFFHTVMLPTGNGIALAKKQNHVLLWILFFMVVTEQQAGERSTIMRLPFMQAPR